VGRVLVKVQSCGITAAQGRDAKDERCAGLVHQAFGGGGSFAEALGQILLALPHVTRSCSGFS
jgi:hypothetical protein